MKLILSSCDFHNENSRAVILAHLPKPIEECRMMYVPNERATAKDIRGEKFILEMMGYGFVRENTIIFDYYHPDRYINLELDVLYAAGGNSFGTLRRLRKHGFDQVLADYIRRGVPYIGGSAGAHIISQDLSHLGAFDPIPQDMTDLRGLGLFDGILVCHYKEDRRALYERLQEEGKYPVHALTNDDSLVIEEGQCCFYRGQDEVKKRKETRGDE